MFKATIEEDKFIPQFPENFCNIKEEPDIEHSEEPNDLGYQDAVEFVNVSDFQIEETTDTEHSDQPNDLVHEYAGDNIKIEEVDIKTECLNDEIIDDVCSLRNIIKVDDHNNQNEPKAESCSSGQIETVNVKIKNEQQCFEMGADETVKHDMVREDEEHRTNINNEKRKAKSRLDTNEKPYACDMCGKTFTKQSYLKQHKLIHTGVLPFVCDVCNKGFIEGNSLLIHKRIHTGDKPYVCDVCDKRFTQTGNLARHKRIHTGDKPHVCDVCNKRFTQSSTLSEHKKVHTSNKPYVCGICFKGFTDSSKFLRHKLMHTCDMPYDRNNQNEPKESCSSQQSEPVNSTVTIEQTCSEMSADETDQHSMNREDYEHRTNIKSKKRKVKSHTNGKPYACDVCGNMYAQMRYLKQHKLVHTGVKPFVCDVCNKGFIESYHLVLHKRIHTGYRPYVCDVCNKGFITSSSLARHKLIHTGDKPYVCDVCNEGFTQSGHLAQHKPIHN